MAQSAHIPFATMSGCTALLLVHCMNKLFLAHVGDSRAIYVSESELETKTPKLSFRTKDHKPHLKKERARIEASGGDVRKSHGERHSRVYAGSSMHPGLAMSRALGDIFAHGCGVVHQPEIVQLNSQSEGEVVVGSDGLWEYTGGLEVAHMLTKKLDKPQEQAECIAAKAYKKWGEHDDSMTDDITVLTYKLQST